MMICVMGHFMVIPYLAPYLVGNVGLDEGHLFLVYLVGGVVTIFTGPFVGKLRRQAWPLQGLRGADLRSLA